MIVIPSVTPARQRELLRAVLSSTRRGWGRFWPIGAGPNGTGAGLQFAGSPRFALLLEITRVNTILPTFATAEDADLNFIAGRRAAGA